MAALTRTEVLKRAKEHKVTSIRLEFTDILGVVKNVTIPVADLGAALDGQIMFDGSSIEGFVRIEESDMYLRPDAHTFVVLPWSYPEGREARMVCDVYNPDGTPFAGCPRSALKRVIKEAEALGYTMMAGPEAEFFLFRRDEDGKPTTITHDAAGYFDLAPLDRGEDARREMVDTLERMGFRIEASHHEVAPGQHEIDFQYSDALATADNICTFRIVVKSVAMRHGLHATFMPKPIFGINGSGMHTHQSLFKGGKNSFYDPKAPMQLSDLCLHYIGGLLAHAPAITAIANPLVNSYKRLVPGYEAPVYIAWSERNRSPLVRIPAKRGLGTRLEFRSPDPSCNPYLALACMLKSGLDGIKRKLSPGKPTNQNIYHLTEKERERLGIKSLPGSLKDAIETLSKDKLVREALGDHIYEHFVEAKSAEWALYNLQVHPWETDRYLGMY